MKINTAFILCAGYGKRLNPITLSKPKPLIEVKNKTLLTRTIELIFSMGINNIKINSFYLPDQITNFVRNHKLRNKIEIINDGSEILDTGGGIKNMIKHIRGDNFLVFNPDTLWDDNYITTVTDMIYFYENNNLNNLLLVTNKKNSFDKNLKGDFNMKNSKLVRENQNLYIYTGLQILNKSIFNDVKSKKFSMNKIWDKEIKNFNLNGFESYQNFLHLTDLSIYNEIIKK